MTRRARANEIIRAALTPPPASRAEAERLVRAAYPWGERAGHPWKEWCKARAVALREIYGPVTRAEVMTELYGPTWVDAKIVCTGLFAAATKGQEGE